MADSNAKATPRRGGTMGGGPGMMGAPGDKPKNFKNTMKQLVSYLRDYRNKFLLVLVLAALGTVFSIVGPKILGEATNQVVDDYIAITTYDKITSSLPAGTKLPAGTTGADILHKMPASVADKIPNAQKNLIENMNLDQKPVFHIEIVRNIVLLLVVLYVLSAAFNYLLGWIMTDITQKVSYNLRRDISHKINRLPLSYFDKKTHGEVLSRVTNDIDTVSQTLNQSLSQIITSIIMIIGIAAMMLSISWQLTLVALLVIPLSFVGIISIVKRSQKQFLRQQNELGHINGHIEEMYGGHEVVQAFNGQKSSIAKFESINDRLYDSGWKSQFLSGMMFPIMNVMGNLGYLGVAIVGGWLAINGRLQIGDIQAFIQYVQQFNQPIMQVANVANVIQSTAAAAERVFEFLDEEEMSPDPVKSTSPQNVKGHIVFNNVKFSYNPDKPIIKDLSLDIKAGQRVAIVGPTGAGKTTLVNLLMRFYNIDSGSIVVDGVDTASMSRGEARKMFGMVLQDTWLFNGTIRDNILYGSANATEEEMIQASKDAHAHHFIQSLPGGYDMVMDEEASNVSQGEKQLLTIARALLAHSPIIILDEATSSVDTRTELLIQEAMNNLLRGKTSFVIAHRLSTIRDADLILVMKDGDVIEQGKHAQLMSENGFYANLYNSQFGE